MGGDGLGGGASLSCWPPREEGPVCWEHRVSELWMSFCHEGFCFVIDRKETKHQHICYWIWHLEKRSQELS